MVAGISPAGSVALLCREGHPGAPRRERGEPPCWDLALQKLIRLMAQGEISGPWVGKPDSTLQILQLKNCMLLP